MSSETGSVTAAFGSKIEHANVAMRETPTVEGKATKVFSAARVLFGAIFLFDGILKWVLIQQGTMQDTVLGTNAFNLGFLNDNWLAFGVIVALGETAAGLALLAGLFQKPAAIGAAAIMLSIWTVSGFEGVYSSGAWSFTGYTDPGGTLMLALVFVVLIFAPTTYGLASRFGLRAKWSGDSLREKVLRFAVA